MKQKRIHITVLPRSVQKRSGALFYDHTAVINHDFTGLTAQ